VKANPVRALDVTLQTGAGLALALGGGAMLAQIVARYVFSAPFVWAEEFATLMLSWITFLGAAAVQRDDAHLSVDSLRAIAAPRVRMAMDIIRRLVIIGCCVVLAYQGTMLSMRMWGLQYPAMEITRSALYLSVTVGAVFSLLFALRSLWRREPPAQGIPLEE